MGSLLAIAFLVSTAIMVIFALVLGYQQWQLDRAEIEKEKESRAKGALNSNRGARISDKAA